LSLSLPFNPHNEPIKGTAVEHYFDNLLPDSNAIRKRVAARFKTGSVDAFDLLRAIGRDCVGAIQLLDEAETPTAVDQLQAVRVDDESIERHLLSVVNPDKFDASGDPNDGFRISLAGAQEKDAYLWWNGAWHKPRGTTPTTHIFKLPLGLIGGLQDRLLHLRGQRVALPETAARLRATHC
jgi:serine/threonine-protein kinase HipA